MQRKYDVALSFAGEDRHDTPKNWQIFSNQAATKSSTTSTNRRSFGGKIFSRFYQRFTRTRLTIVWCSCPNFTQRSGGRGTNSGVLRQGRLGKMRNIYFLSGLMTQRLREFCRLLGTLTCVRCQLRKSIRHWYRSCRARFKHRSPLPLPSPLRAYPRITVVGTVISWPNTR